jgi:hypothetical protein
VGKIIAVLVLLLLPRFAGADDFHDMIDELRDAENEMTASFAAYNAKCYKRQPEPYALIKAEKAFLLAQQIEVDAVSAEGRATDAMLAAQAKLDGSADEGSP